MYFLRLTCNKDQVDEVSSELWEAGTVGVQEEDGTAGSALLSAAFDENLRREDLLQTFAAFAPKWTHVEDADWIQQTQNAWPGRLVGESFFLAAPWCRDPTPLNRHRLIHNPGLACGTGEHPCTQLALKALERIVKRPCVVADIGTGSGILAIAAKLLGASSAIALDIDVEIFEATKENFQLNKIEPLLIAGSVDCLVPKAADIVIANINATVLLSFADDFLRLQSGGAALILTGFLNEESRAIKATFGVTHEESQEGWSCVTCVSEVSS